LLRQRGAVGLGHAHSPGSLVLPLAPHGACTTAKRIRARRRPALRRCA
jgi:hypothetical protein